MLLDKLVYEVLTEVREMSDDGNITPEYIAHLIDVYRAKYIQQEYSKRNLVNQTAIQSFNLKLTSVDSSNDFDIATGTAVLESEELPNLLNLAKKPGIIRIRTLDAVKGEVNFTTVDRAKLSSYSKFKTINAYLENNNKLYLIGNTPSAGLMGNITVDAVLESPSEISGYEFKDRLVGSNEDDYPVDLGLWSMLKDEIIKHITISYQVPNDNVNNQVDDKEIQQQQPRRAQR